MVYKIVYKVVAVLLFLSTIPLALFTPMIRIVGEVSFAKSYVGEDVSLYDIYDLFLKKDAALKTEKTGEMTDAVRHTMPWLITSGSLLGAALLVAIAGGVLAIVCRKKFPALIFSGAGLLLVIGTFKAFGTFAAPFVDGTISTADLGLVKEGIFSLIFSAMFQLKVLQLSTAPFLMLGAFIAVFLWTGAFMLVEIGEEPKKIKKVK